MLYTDLYHGVVLFLCIYVRGIVPLSRLERTAHPWALLSCFLIKVGVGPCDVLTCRSLLRYLTLVAGCFLSTDSSFPGPPPPIRGPRVGGWSVGGNRMRMPPLREQGPFLLRTQALCQNLTLFFLWPFSTRPCLQCQSWAIVPQDPAPI